jgi:hypothetical protein
MQTSQGYIFGILQHFATKFCNFTNFNKFFTGIYFFLPKSKISLTCKLSIAFNIFIINRARSLMQRIPNNFYKQLSTHLHNCHFTIIQLCNQIIYFPPLHHFFRHPFQFPPSGLVYGNPQFGT